MNRIKLCAACLAVSMVVLPAFSAECHITPGWEAMETRDISLEFAGKIQTRSVHIADNSSERAAGYQWICADQAKNTAVLFVFPQMIPSAFHMRNVFVPLDIHFFDEQGEQVDAMVMRPEPPGYPARPRYYQAAGSFRYALEIARPEAHDLQSVPAQLRLLVESLN